MIRPSRIRSEIQDHSHYANQKTANGGIMKISQETGIPIVATGDIHYINKDDSSIQDTIGNSGSSTLRKPKNRQRRNNENIARNWNSHSGYRRYPLHK